MQRIKRLIETNASFVFDGKKIIYQADFNNRRHSRTASEPVFEETSRKREYLSSSDMQSVMDALEKRGY